MKSSYGNDSVALVRWLYENGYANVTVLYNLTGWHADDWPARVERLSRLARSYGFEATTTQGSLSFMDLVRAKKSFPRQGIQFCTEQLKIQPSMQWLEQNDPDGRAILVTGVRRAESFNRRFLDEWDYNSRRDGGRHVWRPLIAHGDDERDELILRAGEEILPHRSKECWPCINANKADLLILSEDEARVQMLERFEQEMGYTSEDKPRTFFRPHKKMGATGIREVLRWAASQRGKFVADDGGGDDTCEKAGYCE